MYSFQQKVMTQTAMIVIFLENLFSVELQSFEELRKHVNICAYLIILTLFNNLIIRAAILRKKTMKTI